MTDRDPSETPRPLSSEEMIRQARESLSLPEEGTPKIDTAGIDIDFSADIEPEVEPPERRVTVSRRVPRSQIPNKPMSRPTQPTRPTAAPPSRQARASLLAGLILVALIGIGVAVFLSAANPVP
jgi:hypothetical protein